jgi:hypothetical protein
MRGGVGVVLYLMRSSGESHRDLETSLLPSFSVGTAAADALQRRGVCEAASGAGLWTVLPPRPAHEGGGGRPCGTSEEGEEEGFR